MSRSFGPFVVVAAVVAALVIGGLARPAIAQPTATRTVEFLPGFTFDVPADWVVVEPLLGLYSVAQSDAPGAPSVSFLTAQLQQATTLQQVAQAIEQQFVQQIVGPGGRALGRNELQSKTFAGIRITVQGQFQGATTEMQCFVILPQQMLAMLLVCAYPPDQRDAVTPVAEQIFRSFGLDRNGPTQPRPFAAPRTGIELTIPSQHSAVETRRGAMVVGSTGMMDIAVRDAEPGETYGAELVRQFNLAPSTDLSNIDRLETPLGLFRGAVFDPRDNTGQVLLGFSLVTADNKSVFVRMATPRANADANVQHVQRVLQSLKLREPSAATNGTNNGTQSGNTPTTMAAPANRGAAGTVRVIAAGLAAVAVREWPAAAISRELPEMLVPVESAPDADAAMRGFVEGTADLLAYAGTPAQVAAMREKLAGDLSAEPQMVVLAVRGIAVLVNRDCPLTQITQEQVARLLGTSDLERIVTWNELDASAIAGTKFANANVRALGPMPDSALAAQILRILPPAASDFSWRTDGVAGAMQRALRVASDPLALAITDAGWSSANVPALKIVGTAGGDAVAISVDSMVSGEYPLTEQLVIFIRADASTNTKAVLRAMLSPRAQQHLARPARGWLPLTDRLRRAALDGVGR